jgi:uncharacterized protein
MSSTEPVVLQASDRSRFEIRIGDVVAGLAAYVDSGEQRIFFHTEVGDEFGGRGLAGTLVREALTATRDAGLRIVPVCPYVKKWLASHGAETGLASAVDPVTPDALAVVKQATA